MANPYAIDIGVKAPQVQAPRNIATDIAQVVQAYTSAQDQQRRREVESVRLQELYRKQAEEARSRQISEGLRTTHAELVSSGASRGQVLGSMVRKAVELGAPMEEIEAFQAEIDKGLREAVKERAGAEVIMDFLTARKGGEPVTREEAEQFVRGLTKRVSITERATTTVSEGLGGEVIRDEALTPLGEQRTKDEDRARQLRETQEKRAEAGARRAEKQERRADIRFRERHMPTPAERRATAQVDKRMVREVQGAKLGLGRELERMDLTGASLDKAYAYFERKVSEPDLTAADVKDPGAMALIQMVEGATKTTSWTKQAVETAKTVARSFAQAKLDSARRNIETRHETAVKLGYEDEVLPLLIQSELPRHLREQGVARYQRILLNGDEQGRPVPPKEAAAMAVEQVRQEEEVDRFMQTPGKARGSTLTTHKEKAVSYGEERRRKARERQLRLDKESSPGFRGTGGAL